MRYCTKRDTEWVGYKTHLSETCDEGYPDLITQALTTLSTTPDYVMGPPIQQELARDLLPGQQLFDAGYVDAELLVTAQRQHQIEGPLGQLGLAKSRGNGVWLRGLCVGLGGGNRSLSPGVSQCAVDAWARCLR